MTETRTEPPAGNTAEVPSGNAPSRRQRCTHAAFLLGSAACLAWLGPEWHVSPLLILLGTVLLFAFSAAALFSRAAALRTSWSTMRA